MRTLIIGIFILLSFATSLAGAARSFPQNAKAGQLLAREYPHVKIDNQTFRLAPGTRIFDRDNRMILPNYLPETASVVYQIGINGELSNMWLLTTEEAALVKPQH